MRPERSRPSRPSMAIQAGGCDGSHPRPALIRAGKGRSRAEDGSGAAILLRDAKPGRPQATRRRKIAGPRHCGPSQPPAQIALWEGRRRGPCRHRGTHDKTSGRFWLRHHRQYPRSGHARVGLMNRATSSGASCPLSAAVNSSIPSPLRSSLKSPSCGDSNSVSIPAFCARWVNVSVA